MNAKTIDDPQVLQAIQKARLVIIEGIAGAGKTPLFAKIKERWADEDLVALTEDQMLFSWHLTLSRPIAKARVSFFHAFLDEVEANPKKKYLVERFHLSQLIFHPSDAEYANLIHRLEKLPVHVLIPFIDEASYKPENLHHERGKAWNDYLEQKLAFFKQPDIKSMYLLEQRRILQIAKEQKIPYMIVKVK